MTPLARKLVRVTNTKRRGDPIVVNSMPPLSLSAQRGAVTALLFAIPISTRLLPCGKRNGRLASPANPVRVKAVSLYLLVFPS